MIRHGIKVTYSFGHGYNDVARKLGNYVDQMEVYLKEYYHNIPSRVKSGPPKFENSLALLSSRSNMKIILRRIWIPRRKRALYHSLY